MLDFDGDGIFFLRTILLVAVERQMELANIDCRFLGFLLGTTLTGFGAYYYLFDEFRSANGVVLMDVVELQDSIRNLESHVIELEKKVNK